jgi:RNA polymerase sigma factor (sigma-70 family)
MTTAEAPVFTSEPGALAKLDDARLVSVIRDGYDEAFEVFYARYHADVLSFCRHMLGSLDDAEDAVQQTFLATYRQIHNSSPPRHPRAWLYTVARNRCLTTIRARRESSLAAHEPSTEGLAEEVERRHELRELLGDVGRLPEDQRVALLLFELGALDQSEIAETIGCAPKKVKALVYQARTTLAHRAEARNARCGEIRQQLATLRGGTLNSRALKHHLQICEGCAEYRDEVRRQRARFGLILPVIPLAASHGGALAALGLGKAAAPAAGAAHGSAAHTALGGTSHVARGPFPRLAAHVARPRVAAIGALTAGAAVSLVLITGGHGRHGAEPAVPPAQAAALPAKGAATPVATATHRARRRAKLQAAASRGAPRRAGAQNPAALIRQPQALTPPASEPRQAPAPGAPQPRVRQAPPAASPPVSGPAHPLIPGPAPAPAPPPPGTACGPSGQGSGNAWGRCKGPDGLPTPAEQNRQGTGTPGGKPPSGG